LARLSRTTQSADYSSEVPYRGYLLKEITLALALGQPVEIWQRS
jgi:hypothetical protein